MLAKKQCRIKELLMMKKFLSLFLMLAIPLLLASGAADVAYAQTDYYVDQLNGDDGNDGLAWGTAKASVQAAVDIVSPPALIHVAEGTYTENVTVGADDIAMMGGYPEGGGARDPESYISIIDGNASGAALTVSNSVNFEVDGFTIRNGSTAYGGGISLDSCSSCVISNCIIEQNEAATAGAGIACLQSSVTLENNTIQNNTGAGADQGGGIFVSESDLTVTANIIQDNKVTASSAFGGGLSIDSYSIVLMNENELLNNYSVADGSHDTHSRGGGIYCLGDLTVTDCLFSGNEAQSTFNGGYNGNLQKYSYGGAVFCGDGGIVVSSENDYSTNQAYAYIINTSSSRRAYAYSYGGALYCDADGYMESVGDSLHENIAYAYGQDTASSGRGYGYSYGGALYLADGSSALIRAGVTVENNSATAQGSGSGSRDYAYVYGGGICTWGATADVTIDGITLKTNHLSATPNNTSLGEGIYVRETPLNLFNSFIHDIENEAVYLYSSDAQIIHCTIVYNDGYGIYADGGIPLVRNCILWGNNDDLYGLSAEYSDIQSGDAGPGNLDPPCPPMFAGNGDYHILPGSCCIDRGYPLDIPDHDFDGDYRPYAFGIPDIGADETSYDNPSPTPYATPFGTPSPVPTPANDYYVDGELGQDYNDGLSWSTAKETLGAALAAAAANGGGAVHVAAWTYHEKINAFDNLRLYGGYPAGGGPRDPSVNITVIDADNEDTPVRIGAVSNVVVDGFVITGGTSEYGGGIYIGHAKQVVINGNTITQNTAVHNPATNNLARGGGIYAMGTDIRISANKISYNAVTGSDALGGGIYCPNGYDIVISGNTLSYNTCEYAGGGCAITNQDSPVEIYDNVFEWNEATGAEGRGGGLFVDAGAEVSVTDNEFRDNRASNSNNVNSTVSGGGIYCAGQAGISGNLFLRNQSYNYFNSSYGDHAYQYAYGGALFCASGGILESSLNTYLENQAYSHSENTSSSRRGYAYGYGAAAYCDSGGKLVMSNDSMIENLSYAYGKDTASSGRGYAYARGGALYCTDESEVTIGIGSIIEHNLCHAEAYGSTRRAYTYGGGIYVTGAAASVLLDGLTVRNNSLYASPNNASIGHGIYVNSTAVQLFNSFIVENPGTGLYLEDSDSYIVNNTVAYNLNNGIYGAGGSAPLIRNCILWGHPDDLVNVTATYSDIQGADPGEGNLDPPCNPVFIGNGDYHLTEYSCCIDRGSFEGHLDHDVDGEQRPYAFGVPDIGADEVPGTNPTPTPYVTPFGTPTVGPSPTPSMDFYVDATNGDDENDGLSWGSAKASISASVNLAESAGGGNVHVAEGHYTENIFCVSYLTLLGGYPEGGGTRDPETHLTVIDGAHRDTVVRIPRVINVTIDGFMIVNGRGDYGGGFYVGRAQDILISNNRIENNYCVDVPSSRNLALGGGLYIHGNNIRLIDNTIIDNFVEGEEVLGGGIYCGGGSKILLDGNTISFNYSENIGGGIYVADSESPVTMTGNLFEGNIAESSNAKGGAVFVDSPASVALENNDFISNSVVSSNIADTTMMGGAVYCSGEAEITSNLFRNNESYNYYNGSYGNYLYQYSYGGALYCAEGCLVNSSDNEFIENSVHAHAENTSSSRRGYAYGYGAAIYCDQGSNLQIHNDILANNIAYTYAKDTASNGRGYAYSYGAALYCDDGGALTVGRGTLIEENLCEAYSYANSTRSAYVRGGGLYINGSNADVHINSLMLRSNQMYAEPNSGADGYGLYVNSTPLTLYNTFIVDHPGTAIYLNSAAPTIVNNTIAGNSGYGIYGSSSGSAFIRNCLLWNNDYDLNGLNADYSNIQSGTTGEGNLTPPCNPSFVGDGDYHLRHSSCCIDRGTNNYAPMDDFDGDYRPFGMGRNDIGADETSYTNPTPPPSVTPYTPTPTGSPTPTPASEYYVDLVNGDDENDGLSWATAKASITAALNSAVSGGFIRTAEGEYKENIQLLSDITLLGGYPSGGGARDPSANTTIINGRHDDAAVIINNASNTTIDGFVIINGRQYYGGGISCYSSRHVILQDCIIESNTAGENGNLASGGGAFFAHCYDVRITGSTFLNNQVVETSEGYGGALYIHSCGLMSVDSCSFESNAAPFAGGAIACFDVDDTIVISDNEFTKNLASGSGTSASILGGAVYCADDASPVISSNTFTENTAAVTGREAMAKGGALFLDGESLLFENKFLENESHAEINTSYGNNLYVYSYGGALFAGENSDLTVDSNFFRDNIAYSYCENTSGSRRAYAYSHGGGIFCAAGSQTEISMSTFLENTAYASAREQASSGHAYAYTYGGAVYVDADANALIHESALITDNKGESYASGNYRQRGYSYGGGVYIADGAADVTVHRALIDNNDAWGSPDHFTVGDGIYINSNDPVRVVDCFITNNQGYGIYCNSSGENVKIYHDTIADNTNYGIYRNSGSLEITNCIVWNHNDDLYGVDAVHCALSDGDAGEGNISDDPQFVGNNDYHIHETSPCVNAGTFVMEFDLTDQDYDGHDRPLEGEFDIGADEFSGEPILNLTVFVDGIYSSGSQLPAPVDIELRQGSSPGTAVHVYARIEDVPLDANGNTGDMTLTGYQGGDFYLFVDHKNHLSVITQERLHFTYVGKTTVNLSDETSPNYKKAYGFEPMSPEADDMLAIRGGDADADGVVNASGDFVKWLVANGSVPADPNWDDQCDFNDDNVVNSADYSIWLNQNGRISFVPDINDKSGAGEYELNMNELELKITEYSELNNQAFITVELILNAETPGKIQAVDALIAYNEQYLGQPVKEKDYLHQNTTDFSRENNYDCNGTAYHYSRGAMPNQEGYNVRNGENKLMKLIFPVKTVHLQSLTGVKTPLGLVPGITGISLEEQESPEIMRNVEKGIDCLR